MELPLRKYKKSALITLIKKYEEDIDLLHQELQDMPNNAPLIKYVVLDAEKDDKKIIYIKKRMICVQDKNRCAIYSMELERLLKERNIYS